MKLNLTALTVLIATTSISIPVAAQIRNPSQDFFQQGREQLEQEIQFLQIEPLTLEKIINQTPSEPLLEVSPTPVNSQGDTDTPLELETPSEQESPQQ